MLPASPAYVFLIRVKLSSDCHARWLCPVGRVAVPAAEVLGHIGFSRRMLAYEMPRASALPEKESTDKNYGLPHMCVGQLFHPGRVFLK